MEFLTSAIAKEYRDKAKALPHDSMQDIGGRRALRIELQERCGVTELEAVNIINGHNTGDYCMKYLLRAHEAGMTDQPKKNWHGKHIRREIY